ncbi:MAG: permease [candidate division WOR-3 bacterium]
MENIIKLVISLPGLSIFYSMSEYLLIGFLAAGIAKFFVSEDQIYKNLSGKRFSDIFKAAVLGVPIPVCSCGVIPLVEHLKRSGASKKSIVSFLISTPTTGFDSILATYSLLGPIFAVFRPISSFLGGLLGGTLVKFFVKEEDVVIEKEVKVCEYLDGKNRNLKEKFLQSLKYSFFELVESTGKWIILGIVLGTLISFLIPDTVFKNYFSNRFLSYLFMMFVGIPLYVCATGSIPIALSLILKGISPGAALVFLITGPATNSATILFVLKRLGKKTLLVYLISVVIISIVSGFILDLIFNNFDFTIQKNMHSHTQEINYLKLLSSLILIVLILRPYFIRIWRKKMEGRKFYVPDISCSHCAKTIENSVIKVKGVKKVFVDIKRKEVYVQGEFDNLEVEQAIRDAGYTPQ